MPANHRYPRVGDALALTGSLLFFFLVLPLRADPGPQLSAIVINTNRDVSLTLKAALGVYCRIEVSTNLTTWTPLATLKAAATTTHVDPAPASDLTRYYRALQLTETNALTGDHLATSEGDAILHPVNHASFLIQWNGKTIYNDPVGASSLYQGFARADLILVSHSHGDHFSASTLDAVKGPNTIIIAPAAVFSSLSTALKNITIPLANGASTNVIGATIDAIPAYNSNHPKGAGNGYVLTLGGKRIYISGDTGDVAEMKALTNIDAAFVCINVPYTMTVSAAAAAVREFRPRTVYPYHFRNQDNSLSDLNSFRRLVSPVPEVTVRNRKWY